MLVRDENGTITGAIATNASGDKVYYHAAKGVIMCTGSFGSNKEMVREFFYAVSYSAMMNLHLKIITPGNSHHMAEALFKAFGKALDQATRIDERIGGVLSTKGMI